jgi:hypothetical protein
MRESDDLVLFDDDNLTFYVLSVQSGNATTWLTVPWSLPYVLGVSIKIYHHYRIGDEEGLGLARVS